MSKYQKLILNVEGPVATITMNRPECHNALDRELSAELNQAFREVRDLRSECRVLVLRGAGDTFCAGDDIKEMNLWNSADPVAYEGYYNVRQYQDTVKMLDELTPVTIAAVDGVCMGGGLELTLSCDFVIATDRSRWGMPEIDWDITPGWGGISRIFRYAGRRKAKEWNMLGMEFDAKTALEYDMCNRLCAPEKLNAEVKALVDVVLAKSAVTMRRTKFTLNQAFEMPSATAWSMEVPMLPMDPRRKGMSDFKSADGRATRRVLSKNFWRD